ncbi:cell wall hydrolase [Paracoccus sp. PARArs4]|uniref:cell wall hydrolase n=1 Tax=Paracoccus sp. PARArs4 TaxID=2853442 RepID=UPI0024A6660E|nr:cell wall hydrolase [Paracoccus sp. PARArs4]
MPMLPHRLAHACLCAAAALTIYASPTAAGGTGSLFSAEIGLFGAAASTVTANVDSPLLYANHEADLDTTPTDDATVYLTSNAASYSQQDLQCLAEALYHEARGEGRQGQAAVAEVILNRVDSRTFPSSVCGVINQPSQFSYTIGGAKPIRNKSAYLRAVDIAKAALSGAPRNLTGGATYFHTPSVRPAWARRFQRTVQIGRHIFYSTGQRVASN